MIVHCSSRCTGCGYNTTDTIDTITQDLFDRMPELYELALGDGAVMDNAPKCRACRAETLHVVTLAPDGCLRVSEDVHL